MSQPTPGFHNVDARLNDELVWVIREDGDGFWVIRPPASEADVPTDPEWVERQELTIHGLTFFKVVPWPSSDDPYRARLCVDEAPERLRWHGTQGAAEAGARGMCRLIGKRPKPGIQDTNPIPIVVVEVSFQSPMHLARGERCSAREVYRIWQQADGSFSTEEPE